LNEQFLNGILLSAHNVLCSALEGRMGVNWGLHCVAESYDMSLCCVLSDVGMNACDVLIDSSPTSPSESRQEAGSVQSSDSEFY